MEENGSPFIKGFIGGTIASLILGPRATLKGAYIVVYALVVYALTAPFLLAVINDVKEKQAKILATSVCDESGCADAPWPTVPLWVQLLYVAFPFLLLLFMPRRWFE